jgi:CheY-like chemotaxis protein
METDGTRIRQIVKNFLSNALKFTEHGYIRLSAACSDCGQFTIIEVTDTGIGIAKDKLEHIFERFKQIDEHTTARKFGGTGLGLSISRDLAHLLGGEIHVESQLGVGSSFAFILHNTETCNISLDSLPGDIVKIKNTVLTELINHQMTSHELNNANIDAINIELNHSLKSALTIGELKGKSILIVDDNIRNLFTMAALFENTGLSVLTAQSGEEACQLLQMNSHIGLVLTDLLMPEMNGYELITKIRNNYTAHHLPIIAISVQTETEAKQKSLEVGANTYLTKPSEADALISSINLLIRVRLVKSRVERLSMFLALLF